MKAMARVMVVALIASLLTLVPAASSSANCFEEFNVKAYRVKVTPDKHVYRIGEKAHFAVTVIRKTTGEPAEDVNVFIGVARRDNWSYGAGKTNSRGRDRIAVKIQRQMPTGDATLHAYAYKKQADAVCASYSEYGHKKQRHAIRITR